MGRKGVTIAAAAVLAVALAACTGPDQDKKKAAAPLDPKLAKFTSGSKKSGYLFANPETQEMQDDDFSNPAFLWVEIGEKEWSKVEGAAGKSCASCHGDAKQSMKGVGVTYPKYHEGQKKLVNIEQRVNLCRTENMKAPAWKWESDELLGMTTFVKLQSRGMPMNVRVDGPAAPFYEKGKQFYYQRRGQFDLACANCHEDHAGDKLGVELLSQGQSNGFPAYRLKWQKLGSLHRRFRGCNEEVRAEQLPNGADDYVNLELFVAARGNGLLSETPSVRR
jgi:sulfur-oxidizing protein SoxA